MKLGDDDCLGRGEVMAIADRTSDNKSNVTFVMRCLGHVQTATGFLCT